jgi:hypothetical protein
VAILGRVCGLPRSSVPETAPALGNYRKTQGHRCNRYSNCPVILVRSSHACSRHRKMAIVSSNHWPANGGCLGNRGGIQGMIQGYYPAPPASSCFHKESGTIPTVPNGGSRCGWRAGRSARWHCGPSWLCVQKTDHFIHQRLMKVAGECEWN